MTVKRNGRHKKIRFAMAFHCYQPVFNFDNEIENAYQNAYKPFLRILERFNSIKVSFHYSGNLLEWLEKEHPEYIEKVRNLVSRGQVELIGGGCFDPVMTMIPERDRREQLEMNNEIIARMFDVNPKGAWIAERVWGETLADTFIKTGIRYTIIDDYHLVNAGINPNEVLKPYFMRRNNQKIVLFPASTKLRYLMPFSRPEVVLDYIKDKTAAIQDENVHFFFADDGEKFGAWPYTFKWVYKKNWLENFFQLIEDNNREINTVTYSEVLETSELKEIRYVPESSYPEMMKWSGGNFKNFFEKYHEADRMYKRMLLVSDRVKALDSSGIFLGASGRIKEAKKELYKAQSNCAYWHGVFGGVYLPHLRSGVYNHLIKAQDMADEIEHDSGKKISSIEWAFDELGRETFISNQTLNVFVKAGDGGSITELDYKPKHLNLTNTMSRIRETYHEKLNKNYSAKIKQARKAVENGKLADVNDALGIGRRGLRKALVYDDYSRMSFLTHIFSGKKMWDKKSKTLMSNKNFLKGKYNSEVRVEKDCIRNYLFKRDKLLVDCGHMADLEISKEIVAGTGPSLEFAHRIRKYNNGKIVFKYGVEFNFLIWDKKFMLRPKLMKTRQFSLKDRYSGVIVSFFLNDKFSVLRYPIYSINETETGLNKTFQGVSVLVLDEYDSSFDRFGIKEMKINFTVN
ncbi:MAG: alpha-amylase/4-alpha-glucanotransferase domain-containing protein [Candidatus Omnitrophota bacterium]